MTETLTLYHWPQSRGVVAHWMLEEVGVDYDVVLLDLQKGAHKSAEFLRINPMGKIPALTHGDVVVTENPAICAYLADAFPQAGLAPAVTDPRRGTYYRWLFFAHGCVEPAMIDRMAQRPDIERRGMLGYGSYDDTFAALETALVPGPYILGDMFSAADVIVGSALRWGAMMGGIPERPVFKAYADRLGERPALKRSMAKNAAMMPAKAA